MPKYIDASKIRLTAVGTVDKDGDILVSVRDVRKAIEQTPAADVVEVVRCKDCKYLTKEMIGDTLEFLCGLSSGMVNPAPDFYCSYGKRKEKEK